MEDKLIVEFDIFGKKYICDLNTDIKSMTIDNKSCLVFENFRTGQKSICECDSELIRDDLKDQIRGKLKEFGFFHEVKIPIKQLMN